jgi:hypothetical protein
MVALWHKAYAKWTAVNGSLKRILEDSKFRLFDKLRPSRSSNFDEWCLPGNDHPVLEG